MARVYSVSIMTRDEIAKLIGWLEKWRHTLQPGAARGLNKILPELYELRDHPTGREPEPGTLLWKLRDMMRRSFDREQFNRN